MTVGARTGTRSLNRRDTARGQIVHADDVARRSAPPLYQPAPGRQCPQEGVAASLHSSFGRLQSVVLKHLHAVVVRIHHVHTIVVVDEQTRGELEVSKARSDAARSSTATALRGRTPVPGSGWRPPRTRVPRSRCQFPSDGTWCHAHRRHCRWRTGTVLSGRPTAPGSSWHRRPSGSAHPAASSVGKLNSPSFSPFCPMVFITLPFMSVTNILLRSVSVT